ncbi:MAG TPA: FAD-dependent oxidoreductase, partial [Pseudolabrys sp.]|nr:FAD-dependent oxidoreductase [Pseudolabrys sp.]
MDENREVDLLVAGAGPAGLTAALVASLEGLDVLLCEKSDQVGGTGSTSAGTLWIPGNSQSRSAGFADSAEQADRYLDTLIGEKTNRAIRNAFLQSGPKVIDYLSARTDVQFLPCGKHPDYRSNMPGAAISGRAIVPVPFDGRLLGADFGRIRPPVPEFMVFGGMMVGKADIPRLIGRFRSISNFVYSAKLFARYLADRLRYRRGTRIMMGNALIGRLFYSLRKRNVHILYGARIVDLIGDRRGITGARLAVGGDQITIKVRKGVVLATGGY